MRVCFVLFVFVHVFCTRGRIGFLLSGCFVGLFRFCVVVLVCFLLFGFVCFGVPPILYQVPRACFLFTFYYKCCSCLRFVFVCSLVLVCWSVCFFACLLACLFVLSVLLRVRLLVCFVCLVAYLFACLFYPSLCLRPAVTKAVDQQAGLIQY